jgi:hypothetical protein
MWSGPRNISTALMRSWENRPDTAVIDEPFYAFYLQATGKQHPGSQEIVAQSETAVGKIITTLTGPVPRGCAVFYQKQMTHHLVPGIGREWLLGLTNCFLIRDPAEVIVSYLKKNHTGVEVDDLGFVQQLDIFEYVREFTGSTPPVIDAADVLRRPEQSLRLLCRAVGVEFDRAMLSWPPGLRPTDGMWAKHWYNEVARSTSFEPYQAKTHEVPDQFARIHDQCRACYEQLYQYRLCSGAP